MKNELTELSKTTLGNYVNKAGNSRIDIAKKRSDLESKHLKAGEKVWSPDKKVSDDAVKERKDLRDKSDKLQIKDIKRQFGIHKAVNRMTKESYESLGLLVQSIQEGNASNMSQLFDKIMLEKIADLVEQRKQEIAEDLFSEEQIDELSKDTLNKYVNKATRDMRAADYSSGAHSAKSTISAMSGDIKSSDMHAKESNRKSNLADKRYSGILKAHRKLSK